MLWTKSLKIQICRGRSDITFIYILGIDIEARKQIMFLIADRLNDTVYLQSTLIENCEKKINETIRQCTNCQACPV